MLVRKLKEFVRKNTAADQVIVGYNTKYACQNWISKWQPIVILPDNEMFVLGFPIVPICFLRDRIEAGLDASANGISSIVELTDGEYAFFPSTQEEKPMNTTAYLDRFVSATLSDEGLLIDDQGEGVRIELDPPAVRELTHLLLAVTHVNCCSVDE